MPSEHEYDWTGRLDDAAIRAGVAQINTNYDLGGTVTIEWIDNRGNTIRTEERSHEWAPIREVTTFDGPLYTYDTNGTGLIGITNDIDDRYAGPEGREYIWPDLITIDKADVYIHGEWTGGDEEQSDIKEERGGALDEFLKEFNPQQTITERSDEQE